MSESSAAQTASGVAVECTRIEQRYRTVRSAFWALLVGWGIYQAAEILEVIAGKTTAITVIGRFLLETGSGFSVSALLLLSAGLFIWARRERALRLQTIERLSGRIVELEQQIDPDRSTSGLTPRGETRPDDR